MLRFALEPTIFRLDEEDEITPPTSPTIEIQHRISILEVIPDATTSVQAELQDTPRRSARLATGGPAKSPKPKGKASRVVAQKERGRCILGSKMNISQLNFHQLDNVVESYECFQCG